MEGLNRIYALLEPVSRHSKIFTVALEYREKTSVCSKPRSINLRAPKKNTNTTWSRIIFDTPENISLFMQGRYSKLDIISSTIEIRKLDIVTPIGTVHVCASGCLSTHTIFMFGMNIGVNVDNILAKSEEYISISDNKFNVWSDDNTKIIKGTDNGFHRVVSVSNSHLSRSVLQR